MTEKKAKIRWDNNGVPHTTPSEILESARGRHELEAAARIAIKMGLRPVLVRKWPMIGPTINLPDND